MSFDASPAQSAVSALAHRIAIVGPVTVDGIYDPREAVVITEGTPFAVPIGKVFVLTALGTLGMTASARSVISVTKTSAGPAARARGYLVDA